VYQDQDTEGDPNFYEELEVGFDEVNGIIIIISHYQEHW